VEPRNGQTYNVLIHGGIDHGRQNVDPKLRDQPISYFYPSNPIGQIFTQLQQIESHPPYAVVGLGVGTLATYGKPGQTVHFYEIDPAVLRLSEPDDGSEPYFWYLHDAKKKGVKLDVILGDGRLKLEDAPPNFYQVIVLDAFSSDAIPVHLLTVEAVRLYLSKLRPDGILIFNVTNRYVNLPPALADLARELDLECLQQADYYDRSIPDKFGSDWCILFRKQARTPPVNQSLSATAATGALYPGLSPVLPFGAMAMVPPYYGESDLRSRLDYAKWNKVTPYGRAPWTDRFQDLVRSISWTN
jgi:hypothetical protein